MRMDKKKWSEERVSRTILYGMVGIVTVVFIAFYLVGFEMPFSGNPTFNAPLLTDVLLWLMVIMTVAATVAAVVSLIKTIRKTGQSDGMTNGVPERKIAVGVSAATVLCMVATFLLGSSEKLTVNGIGFSDVFWLKTSDMFVCSSLVMLFVAILAVLFGATRYKRKERR